jgi:hypothetical protein
MTRIFTVPVDGLHFEVPVEEISDTNARRCEQLIRDLLNALPFDPVFDVGEAYTWASFGLVEKDDGESEGITRKELHAAQIMMQFASDTSRISEHWANYSPEQQTAILAFLKVRAPELHDEIVRVA